MGRPGGTDITPRKRPKLKERTVGPEYCIQQNVSFKSKGEGEKTDKGALRGSAASRAALIQRLKEGFRKKEIIREGNLEYREYRKNTGNDDFLGK